MPPPAPLIRKRHGPSVAEAAPRPDDGLASPLGRFLIRQPILDRDSGLVGYELVIRDKVPLPVLPGARDLQQIHDEMLLVSCVDLNYQQALGQRLTFLGITAATLANPLLAQLPREQVVLAFDAATADDELVARCAALAADGWALALDGYHAGPEEALLAHCRYVRYDILREDIANLVEHITRLRKLDGLSLVAREVHTEEIHSACDQLSFDLFQGYYFTQLQPGVPRRIDSSRQRVIELLNLVMSRAESAQLEAKIKEDTALSYKLLRLINSPAFGLRAAIESIGHALMLLGHNQLYRWLTLLLFTAGPSDPRNRPLLQTALVRARFCENLWAAGDGRGERGGLFLTGILSTLDALLNLPMPQALGHLLLPPAVVDCLTRGEGVYAPYHRLALACERFDQETIAAHAGDLGLSAEQVNLAHVDALIWSESLSLD